MKKTTIRLAADTHVGYVRSNNEDSFILCSDFNSADWYSQKTDLEVNPIEDGVLAVVADGMGGAMAGEIASAIAIESFQNQFTAERIRNAIVSDDQILKLINDTVTIANDRILAHYSTHPDTKGMGTTIVLSWIINGKAYISWCGDSRCYVYNDNRGLIQLTHDHSYVQQLVDNGLLAPEEMNTHPYSNYITRCLGDTGDDAQSECDIYNLNDGDIILLCSDGLTSMCRDTEIEQIMTATGHNPVLCCERLISSALEAGGYDNVTVVVCEYKTDLG